MNINDLVDIVALSKIQHNTEKELYYKVKAYKEAGDIAFLWSVASNIDQLLAFEKIDKISLSIGPLVESNSYLGFNGTVFYNHDGYDVTSNNGFFISNLKFEGEQLTQVTNVFSELANQVEKLCLEHHRKYPRPQHIETLNRRRFSKQEPALAWFKEEFPTEFAAIENQTINQNLSHSQPSKIRSKI